MTTFLPPLANLIAMRTRDPARRSEFERRITGGATLQVFRIGPWTGAAHALPLSPPNSAIAGEYVFAEGREVVAARNDPVAGLDALTRALQHSDPRELARVPGDYTFFRLGPNGAVTAVRSCGGLVPIYVWESDDGVVLSTHATWLAKYASWRGEPDWLITAMWLSGWPTVAMNRSHLAGVKVLHKGERYDLSPGSASRIQRYWYPPLAGELRWPTPTVEEEHHEEFRNILISSLRDNLDPAGSNLLSLSGGVDSASLLALTAGHLKYGVKTFSLIPPPSASFYEREMGYLNALWDEYGVDHQELELRSEEELDRTAQLPPLLFPAFNPTTLGLIDHRGGAPVRVSFGGEHADEVVGSSVFTLPDWSRHVPLWRLPLLIGRWPRSRQLPRLMLEQGIVAKITGRIPVPLPRQLPGWMSGDLQRQFQLFKATVESESRLEGIGSIANPTLWLRIVHMDYQPMQWEICSWLAVRRFSPFSVRRMQDLALRCHPVELLGPNSKRLLRKSLAGLVAPKYLERADKGAFGMQRYGVRTAEESWSRLREMGWSGILGPEPGEWGGFSGYLIALAGCYATRYRSVVTLFA